MTFNSKRCADTSTSARLDSRALVGAAGKAVVYQWEARKRTPSPLFWQRVHELQSGVHPHPVP